jgi:hypothetical protein
MEKQGSGDVFVFWNFNIRRIAAAAFLLLALIPAASGAGIHRGDFPGRSHGVSPGTVPASGTAPGGQHGIPPEETFPEPSTGSQGPERGTSGSGCGESHPGSGSYCVHPGLQKSRGQ